MAKEYNKEQRNMFITVNMSGFQRNLKACIETDQVLLVVGDPGGGKTEGVLQGAEAAGYAAMTRVMSQYSAEDVGGFPIPNRETGMVERFMSDLLADMHKLKAESGKNVLVFLDELNMAAPLVKAACFKLLDEGQAGSHHVPEGTRFAVAGNDPETNILASEFPAPLVNRMCMIRYNAPDFNEWQDYALSRDVHPSVFGYLKENQGRLNWDQRDFSGSDPVPTARSFMAASKKLTWCDNNGSKSGERMAMLASHVGVPTAKHMEAHIKYASQLVPVDECLKNPDNARLPNGDQVVLSYMQAVAMVGAVKDKDTVKAASKYVMRLPEEVQPVFAVGVSQSKRGLQFRTALPMDLLKKVAGVNNNASELDIS